MASAHAGSAAHPRPRLRGPRRGIAFALAAALASALAFVDVAEDYLTNDPLARWDVSFAGWLDGERSAAGLDVFRAITFLGNPAVAFLVAAAVAVVLYRRRRVSEAAMLPFVFFGAQYLDVILKLSFKRPRPDVAFVHLDTYSFPSGHAMVSTAVYGALAYLAWRRLRTPPARALLAGGAVVWIGLIAFSRLYLGEHFLSDVLAGVAGGACWLSLAIALQLAAGDRFCAWFGGSRVDRLARWVTRS